MPVSQKQVGCTNNMQFTSCALQLEKCISREVDLGHIDGKDVFYHEVIDAAVFQTCQDVLEWRACLQ